MKYIKIFQSNNNLLADGIIGRKTMAKIKEVYNIPSAEALAHFMGNTHHESGGFEVVSENLNYSQKGLCTVFPRYFNVQTAAQYQRQPIKIANRIYANRMGNGNEQSGDGWKFRGRGLLQTTGRQNYQALSNFLHVDLITNPDLVATDYYFDSAVYYFHSNNLWQMAATVTDDSIRRVRRAVNGGTIGLDQVSELVKRYYLLAR